jgi:hypothetical protein
VLDRYLEVVRSAVEHHGGMCGRPAGGAIRAVFGVPVAHEDDALRAVRAAVDARDGIGVLNDGLFPELGIFLEVRMAANTGEVLVAPERDDLATGRPVTVAEQLQRDARPGQIILGEQTRALVQSAVETEPTSLVPADEPGGAFRLVELRSDTYGRPLRLDSPMVGRRRQLAALAGAFESIVTDRSCHLFTVLGAAGVGKSRLVAEFLGGLGEVAIVIRGRCLPYGDVIALWPLTEAFREAGVAGTEGDMTPETVARLLHEHAGERALAVVLDDVQWADPALLDLVEQLARSLRGDSVLLLCAARPELVDERPGWGGGIPNASTVLLEPLGEAESERLIDNLLGEADLADPVRDHIIRSAEGNPLFVEELLATLVDQDVLRREAGRWTTTEAPAIPVPASIQALITARIDRLPAGERTVLELASVEGKLFRREVVAELAPSELRGDVDSHLAGLVRKEVVRPQPRGGAFTFRHQILRDTAYASMPMRLRADLHDRVASWLDATPQSSELAQYHRKQAQRYRERLMT